MRNQTICYTGLRRTILFAIVAILVLALSVGIFLYMLSIEPPFFDENSIVGVPSAEIQESGGYKLFDATPICVAALYEVPDIDGKEVKLFLTNPMENTVFLRAELYSVEFIYENGQLVDAVSDRLLAKSGFIRPGEYVETITLKKALKEDMTYAMLKIATYDEATGQSNGYFYVNTILYR